MNMKKTLVAFAALCAALSASAAAGGGLIVKSGDAVAFLGDSITRLGESKPDGYVHLVERALQYEGVAIRRIPAGIDGNRSCDLIRRVDGVLRAQPKFMTISCGINDVWHQERNAGVSFEDFRKHYAAILDRVAASNCTAIVMTTSKFQSGHGDPVKRNERLAPYVAWLREEAKRRGLPLADVNAAMDKAEKDHPDVRLTVGDGIHLAEPGDRVMARAVLRAMGMGEDRLAKIAREAWKPVWVLCRYDLKEGVDQAAYKKGVEHIFRRVADDRRCRQYHLLADTSAEWDLPERFGAQTLWMLEEWESVWALKQHLDADWLKKLAPSVRAMRGKSTFHVLEDAHDVRTDDL